MLLKNEMEVKAVCRRVSGGKGGSGEQRGSLVACDAGMREMWIEE